ncbi:MAG: tRNA (adenosine(37)-N6)-dimethylallyltransferase MiaA [Bacteroidota bacterium]
MERPMIPVIAGPTASGKTGLALALAERIDSIEIVSADSRQIYMGMDIGTAKPTDEELRAVPHHMIDIITPDILFSAGEYAARAREIIAEILDRGNQPLVVGGSGFYVRALFEGLTAPTVDQEILARLAERGVSEGYEILYDELTRIDPVAASAHSPNNHVKLLRALCCWYQTGVPYSRFSSAQAETQLPYVPRYLALGPPREMLYERINARVLEMIASGLIAETEGLLAAGYSASSPGLKTVGYAEALKHIAGEIGGAEMIAMIQQSTRRYAKRQMTWLRNVDGVRWMEQPDVAEAGRWLRGG